MLDRDFVMDVPANGLQVMPGGTRGRPGAAQPRGMNESLQHRRYSLGFVSNRIGFGIKLDAVGPDLSGSLGADMRNATSVSRSPLRTKKSEICPINEQSAAGKSFPTQSAFPRENARSRLPNVPPMETRLCRSTWRLCGGILHPGCASMRSRCDRTASAASSICLRL